MIKAHPALLQQSLGDRDALPISMTMLSNRLRTEFMGPVRVESVNWGGGWREGE